MNSYVQAQDQLYPSVKNNIINKIESLVAENDLIVAIEEYRHLQVIDTLEAYQ